MDVWPFIPHETDAASVFRKAVNASLSRAPLPPTPRFGMSLRSSARLLRLALLPLVVACASLTSTTFIDPGQAFRLGGGQAGAFVVRGTNAGPVAVVVFSEVAGKRDSVITLAPGATVDARFPKTAMAIFKNTSTTATASVAINVTGDIGALGMTSERNPKSLSDVSTVISFVGHGLLRSGTAGSSHMPEAPSLGIR